MFNSHSHVYVCVDVLNMRASYVCRYHNVTYNNKRVCIVIVLLNVMFFLLFCRYKV